MHRLLCVRVHAFPSSCSDVFTLPVMQLIQFFNIGELIGFIE